MEPNPEYLDTTSGLDPTNHHRWIAAVRDMEGGRGTRRALPVTGCTNPDHAERIAQALTLTPRSDIDEGLDIYELADQLHTLVFNEDLAAMARLGTEGTPCDHVPLPRHRDEHPG
jgi:hypothetical protein